ncbi:DUF4339 domain-containing protein [bacterium]|jgi:hypothetical protein|nr:DUF4339 domain-containing protein [bacterium]|tara:strand:- start:4629 stop:5564 length:936 start_codon:yes stop_codon:yes gene_type:complete
MSDKQYEMIGGDGEQYGPFTLQELQETLSQGRADTQTQIRETGSEGWQPLGQLLNLSEQGQAHKPLGAAVLSDQPLDISLALSSGWALFKEHMGIMVGAGGIYFGILFAAIMVGAIIPFANIFVQGPLTGGLIILTLNLSRYDQADISDMFLGFKNYGWLLLVTLVQGAVIVAAIVPGVIVLVVGGLLPVMQAQQAGGTPELAGTSIALLIVGFLLLLVLVMIAAVCTYFWLFLVADKRGEFGEALAAGYRAGKMNFWSILGLSILLGLVVMVSAIPCGLGLIFSIPWSFAIMANAYEQIFSSSLVTRESE